MAGIFLAYHNTAKILGFQYLSVEDMDTMLFGSHLAGNRVFDKSVAILDMLAENIVKDWPRKVRRTDLVCTLSLLILRRRPLKSPLKGNEIACESGLSTARRTQSPRSWSTLWRCSTMSTAKR